MKSHLLTVPLLLVTLAAAQPPADPPAAQPSPPTALIAFRRAPIADLATHPKDAGLRRALGMIPARIAELPDETEGEFPFEAAEAFAQVLGLVESPSRFAIIHTPGSMSGGAFGYGVITGSLLGDDDKPQRLQGLIEDAIQESGEDLPRRSRTRPGMRELPTPIGRLVFGPRRFESGAGYEAYFGTVDDPDAVFAGIPDPSIPGLKPFITGAFDFSALTPAVGALQMAMGTSLPEGVNSRQLVTEATDLGLIGDKAMKGAFEWGTDADSMRFRVHVLNAGGMLRASGLDKGRLTAADFAPIPADAVTASVGLLNTAPLCDAISRLRRQSEEFEEVLVQIESATGVDIERDLIAPFGGASILYSSDTTGGGGLLSYVALVGVKDRATLSAAHDKLRAFAAAQLEQLSHEPDGQPAKYIATRAWTASGQPAFSLIFRGVPIPIELSWALTEQWFVVGLTPQAVATAVEMAAGKSGPGILTRKDLLFTDLDKRETLSWSFGDSARLLRDGYPFLTLLGSALANGVRSPDDAERDPGMVVPPYATLAASVRPAFSVAWRKDDTLTMEQVSDPSLLVNLGTATGNYGRFAPIVGGLGAFGTFSQRSSIGGFGAGPVEQDNRPLADRIFEVMEAIEGPLSWFSWRRAFTATVPIRESLRFLPHP